MERSNLLSNSSRNLSVSSATGSEGGAGSFRSRQSSTTSVFGGLIKRAFSHSHGMSSPPPNSKGRTSSLSVPDANPKGLRLSISAACPTRLPTYIDHPHTMLTTIPPTPSTHETPGAGASPFSSKGDYFAFDLEKEVELPAETGSLSTNDLMQM